MGCFSQSSGLTDEMKAIILDAGKNPVGLGVKSVQLDAVNTVLNEVLAAQQVLQSLGVDGSSQQIIYAENNMDDACNRLFTVIYEQGYEDGVYRRPVNPYTYASNDGIV